MSQNRSRTALLLNFIGILTYSLQASAGGHDPVVVRIDDLHPTQFAIGLRVVEQKVEKLSNLSPSELSDYLKKNPAPFVVGPGQQRYITDKHHLANALLRSGIHQMRGQLIADWSALNLTDFWEKMKATQQVYLYDENGIGPFTPDALPAKIELMKDDPYRSLSGMARDEGCYDQTTTLYAEFAWAQFFRARVPTGSTDADFEKALSRALGLCHSSEAANLPGYSPSISQQH